MGELDFFDKALNFAERLAHSDFTGLVLAILVIVYMIYRARRQDKTISAQTDTIIELTRTTTAAMTESTAVIEKLADALKGMRS